MMRQASLSASPSVCTKHHLPVLLPNSQPAAPSLFHALGSDPSGLLPAAAAMRSALAWSRCLSTVSSSPWTYSWHCSGDRPHMYSEHAWPH